MVQEQFYLGLASIIGAVFIALFPSNYEIVGMELLESNVNEVEQDNSER